MPMQQFQQQPGMQQPGMQQPGVLQPATQQIPGGAMPQPGAQQPGKGNGKGKSRVETKKNPFASPHYDYQYRPRC